MKILFVASECRPYAKTGGLADVVAALPRALAAAGHEPTVVIPRYRGVEIESVLDPGVPAFLGTHTRFPAVGDGGTHDGVRFLFVDDPWYFNRDGIYNGSNYEYHDNAERFATLCRAAIEIGRRYVHPDVVHCHDWQTALIPVILRATAAWDPEYMRVPIVFTIHNMGYQGTFPADVLGRIGLPGHVYASNLLEHFGPVNFLKGGLILSDYLTTVSPTYSREIQGQEQGFGLDGVVRSRADRLTGILNGVDYSVWNPETDQHIAANYSARRLAGKQKCKKDLLETVGLPAEDLSKPVIGVVSRFATQKGFDLIAHVAYEMMGEDVLLVALGSGEERYENLFRALEWHFPDKVRARIAYDDVLAHKIEAGADMFLMPSRYEPCGLNQMYSLRYGTPPIVRATGGLEDTVQHVPAGTGDGTGFKFAHYDGAGLLWAVREALAAFRDSKNWRKIMLNGMAQDFSWARAAADYLRVYEAARASRIAFVS